MHENRNRAVALVGASSSVWLHHVHGRDVVTLDRAPNGIPEADGAVTSTPGLALAAMGADCAPIVLADDRAVAVIHCGWKGAVVGVVEAGAAALRAIGHGPVRAAVGPCICARHYEFGADALEGLVGELGAAVQARTDTGTPAFDLRTAIRIGLDRAGVSEVTDVECCTVESPDHYSFRRDGVTGRQAVLAVKA